MDKQTLPNSTLVLVMGILSIITCLCYGIPGLIIGVIGLILANSSIKKYNLSPDSYLGYGNLKAGKIMSVIGIILSVITIAFYVGIIAYFGMEALQNPELMQEKILELQQ